MIRPKEVLKVAKRIAIVLAVLGIVLSAVSCGQQGNIYGDVVCDGTLFYVDNGGLFSPGLTLGTNYQISAGTYNYAYYVSYLGSYYPPTGYYAGTYSVSANPGGFLTNGSDNYFQLYCSYAGMYKSGAVNSVVPGNFTPQLGTRTWTQGNLSITVTTQVVQASPQETAKLIQAIRK